MISAPTPCATMRRRGCSTRCGGEPLPHVRHSGRVYPQHHPRPAGAENPNPGHPHLSGAPVGGETLSLLDREEALLRRRMAELEAALEEAQPAGPGWSSTAPRRTDGSSSAGRRSGPMCSWRRTSSWKRDRLPAEKAGAPPPGLSQNHRQPVYGGGGGRGVAVRGCITTSPGCSSSPSRACPMTTPSRRGVRLPLLPRGL